MSKQNFVPECTITLEMVDPILKEWASKLEKRADLIEASGKKYDEEFEKVREEVKLEMYDQYPGLSDCLKANSLSAKNGADSNENEVGKLLFSGLGSIGVSMRKNRMSHKSYNGLTKGYETIAMNSNIVPSDFIIIAISGVANSTLSTIRNRLSEKGFKFESCDPGEYGIKQESRSPYWKVVERPPVADDIGQSIDDMSPEEMAELLKLIFEKVHNYNKK